MTLVDRLDRILEVFRKKKNNNQALTFGIKNLLFATDDTGKQAIVFVGGLRRIKYNFHTLTLDMKCLLFATDDTNKQARVFVRRIEEKIKDIDNGHKYYFIRH